MSPIASTLKHREVEERIDLWLYRPLGYALSRVLAPTRVNPNAVTVASMVAGVAGGHLFYSPHLPENLLGMALFVLAALLDSTDGQLARLKGTSSRIGRLLDGWADGVVFASAYLHLALRLHRDGGGSAILALAALAGVSQALQNQMADYYRNAWLAIALPGAKNELDSLESARRMAREAAGSPALERALLGFYVGYTARQERLSPRVSRLAHALAPLPAADPRRERVAAAYRERVKPWFLWLPWIATNFRTIALFAALLAGRPAWFFWFSLTACNLALGAIVAGHERGARLALAEIGPEPC